MKRLLPLIGVLIAGLLAGVLVVPGGSTKTVTTTVTRVSTVEIEVPPEPAVDVAATVGPVTEASAPALATARRRDGQVIFKGEGLVSVGPKAFKAGVYTVRFEQWAPDEPDLDFRSESSSIVIQMNRQPGEVGADTVTVTNATKKKGKTSVTMAAGRWYADVQADHSWVARFTPVK